LLCQLAVLGYNLLQAIRRQPVASFDFHCAFLPPHQHITQAINTRWNAKRSVCEWCACGTGKTAICWSSNGDLTPRVLTISVDANGSALREPARGSIRDH
jgi:hypothetical protein